MKMVHGIALPDHEEHLISYITDSPVVAGKGTYQFHKYRAVIERVNRRGVAIDVGAHVGLWSRLMAIDFAEVLAFEPVAEHADLWRINVTASNARLTQIALGAAPADKVMIAKPRGNSGNARVAYNGHTDVEAVRMSTLDDEIPADYAVGFIKIDCEGYEMFVVQGARRTIYRSHPVIIVEQKPGNGQHYGLGQVDACKLLQGWGYTVAEHIAGDYILTHPAGRLN